MTARDSKLILKGSLEASRVSEWIPNRRDVESGSRKRFLKRAIISRDLVTCILKVGFHIDARRIMQTDFIFKIRNISP